MGDRPVEEAVLEAAPFNWVSCVVGMKLKIEQPNEGIKSNRACQLRAGRER